MAEIAHDETQAGVVRSARPSPARPRKRRDRKQKGQKQTQLDQFISRTPAEEASAVRIVTSQIVGLRPQEQEHELAFMLSSMEDVGDAALAGAS